MHCASLPPSSKCACAQVYTHAPCTHTHTRMNTHTCMHTHTPAGVSFSHSFPPPDSGTGEAVFLCPPWRPALSWAWGLGPAPEPAGSQGRVRSPLCSAETGSPFISGLEWGAGGRMSECIRGACFHFMFNFLQA